MNRRAFVTTIMLSAGLSSWAQPRRAARVCFLAQRDRPQDIGTTYYGAFVDGLRELGYETGRNLHVEWRFAEGRNERLPGLARELTVSGCDVMVTAGTVAIRAAQSTVGNLPVVMATSLDPVGQGFAESLARPGKNITGLSNMTEDVSAKYLEFLAALRPRLARIGFVFNPINTAHAGIQRNLESAAASRGVAVLSAAAGRGREFPVAIGELAAQGAQALVFGIDGIVINAAREIAASCIKHRLPTLFATRENVDAGGLMSYGQSFADSYRRAAAYVDRILRGSRPGELPIEQASKFELVVNRATAKSLGISLSQELLLQADAVLG